MRNVVSPSFPAASFVRQGGKFPARETDGRRVADRGKSECLSVSDRLAIEPDVPADDIMAADNGADFRVVFHPNHF